VCAARLRVHNVYVCLCVCARARARVTEEGRGSEAAVASRALGTRLGSMKGVALDAARSAEPHSSNSSNGY
jgi:hypothetical protein